jgi:hypothetical protein
VAVMAIKPHLIDDQHEDKGEDREHQAHTI